MFISSSNFGLTDDKTKQKFYILKKEEQPVNMGFSIYVHLGTDFYVSAAKETPPFYPR